MNQFAKQFDSKAGKVNPSAPSVSNWNGVRDLIAEEAGLDAKELYVSTISKPGNITVRFKQSDRARKAPVLFAMYTKSTELDRATNRLTELTAERGCQGVVAASDNGTWEVVAIMVSSPGEQLASALTRSFPGAAVILI